MKHRKESLNRMKQSVTSCQERLGNAKQIFPPNRPYSCWDRGSERTPVAFSFSDGLAISRSRTGYNFQRHWLHVQKRLVQIFCMFFSSERDIHGKTGSGV